MVENLGYSNLCKVHYLEPTMNYGRGLRLIFYENNLNQLVVSTFLQNGQIHLFVEHAIDEGLEEQQSNIPFLSLLTSNYINEDIHKELCRNEITHAGKNAQNIHDEASSDDSGYDSLVEVELYSNDTSLTLGICDVFNMLLHHVKIVLFFK